MRTERVNELKENMKSFGKDAYQKSELFDEMFALQQEIVSLTFNQDHAALAELRIWDVERHLEQMNEELGHVADEELQRLIEGSKVFCNLIKAEISGNRGEAKAFRTLEYIKSRNYVLKNVELGDGDLRTELDAVVITPSAITIVEVKNTGKDIFTDEDMDAIKACIEDAENKEAYPFEFDVEQYKTDFATLMAMLEEAAVKAVDVEEDIEEIAETVEVKNVGIGEVVRNILTSKYARYAGGVAAAFAVSVVTGALAATTIH